MATSTGKPKVLIMGCGRVGATLATHFRGEKYEVQVIDLTAEAFLRLGDNKAWREHHTTLGDGTDPSVLERAGIRDADIFIAVTNGDNRNILAVQIAKYQFQVRQVMCRIYDPKRHEIYRDKLGISSICPTNIGADNIYFRLTGRHLTTDPDVINGLMATPAEKRGES